MKVYNGLADFEAKDNRVVTSGTFDGVHKAHHKILNRLQEVAKSVGGESVVITYWPHPRTIVSTDNQQLKLLSTLDEKIELLKQAGVQHLVIIPFTREFSELSSERFIQEILVKKIGTQKLVIGYDHRFGRNREGGFDYLRANGGEYGFEVEEIPRQEIDHLTISSTKIRNALAEGKTQTANELLGRLYSFSGIVAKGRQLGRTIGFPTANIQISETYKLIPCNGVYAVRVVVRNELLGGVMNIGTRPTVEGITRTQEVYVFDFEADIYGETLTVELMDFIRPEQKFDGLEALKKQIVMDSTEARKRIG